jgi:hypothetical protein
VKRSSSCLAKGARDLVFCDLAQSHREQWGASCSRRWLPWWNWKRLISERTKAALAAAKARGVKLGNPNGARALRGKQVGNKQAVVAITANAERRAANLRTIVDDLRSQRFTSVRTIATQLNERGILTPAHGIQRQPPCCCRGWKRDAD